MTREEMRALAETLRQTADLLLEYVAALRAAEAQLASARKALKEIAKQKLSAEIEAEDLDTFLAIPDYEFGYDEVVRIARTALKPDGDGK